MYNRLYPQVHYALKNGFSIHLVKTLDYIISLYNKVMGCNYYQNHFVLITKPVSLFEDDLRGSLAVHAEAPIRQFDDSAHGLPDRVEGVDFVKLLLRDLVSYWLVIPLQVQDQSQQATLCLVAHLLRQTAFLIWGLERGRGRDFRIFTSIFSPIFAAVQWNMCLFSTCGCFALNFSLYVSYDCFAPRFIYFHA